MKKYFKILLVFLLALSVSTQLYGCRKSDMESMKTVHKIDEKIKNGKNDSVRGTESKEEIENKSKSAKVESENMNYEKDKSRKSDFEKHNNEDTKNKTIVIDAGHQDHGMPEHEPIGPGSKKTKPMLTSGTEGVATGVPEYRLALDISIMLKDKFEKSGYKVVMVRTSDNVALSNRQRAEIANGCMKDSIDDIVFLRIHANSSSNSSVSGALTMAPGKNNAFLSKEVIYKSDLLAKDVLNSIVRTTGAVNRGVIYTDEMSGINWSKVPVTIIEVGFMSNPKEDKLMQTPEYRNKIVGGIVDGVDKYFN